MLALASCAACVGAPEVVTVPELGRAGSAIYVVAGEGRTPLVLVADLARAAQFPEFAVAPGKTVELYAFHYACSADVLGLVAGEQPVIDDGHVIPPAQDTYRSELGDGGQTEWRRVAHPPLALTLKIAREIRCAKFHLQKIALPGTLGDIGLFSVPYEDEVIVATYREGFFRVKPAEMERLPALNGLPRYTHFREAEDRVWLYGKDGRLAAGDLREPASIEDQPTLMDRPEPDEEDGPENRAWITGAEPGAPFELYVLHDRGVIARFDGESWRVLRRANIRRGPTELSLVGGMVWLGPEFALAAWGPWPQPVFASTSTAVEWELFDEDMREGASIAVKVPGIGPVLTSFDGDMFTFSDSRWTKLADVAIQDDSGYPAVLCSAPLDDGLLLSGEVGRVTQYQPELPRADKFCHYDSSAEAAIEGTSDPLGVFSRFFITDVRPFGCGFVFLTRSGFNAEVEVGFLTRRF